jgi:guanylate kinase
MKIKNKRLLVLSSPSGGGKSTIAKELLQKFKNLKFSISATTRNIRQGEENGIQYFFLNKDEFQSKIESNDFVEYEQIFGNYYGTLKSEISKAMNHQTCLIFDVDVKGAVSVKNAYPDDSLLIFITPPDLQTLETRLRNRETETEEQIQIRLSRAEMELSYKDKFDFVIVNDNLSDTINNTIEIVKNNMPVSEL